MPPPFLGGKVGEGMSIIMPGSGIVTAGWDPFAPIFKVIDKYYYGVDHQAVRIVCGVAESHWILNGDPSWLFIQGPPSSGKTAISIVAGKAIKSIKSIDDLTSNTFLSGFYGHDAPGILESLGEPDNPQVKVGKDWYTHANGLLTWADWTVILATAQAERDAIYGQRRRIYDGELAKNTGTGIRKSWKGKITILAAVTDAIEHEQHARASMGDRFMTVRWPRADWMAAKMALDQQGQEEMIKSQLHAVCENLFKVGGGIQLPVLTDAQKTILACMADLTAWCRTPVLRKGMGELAFRPSIEGPPRICKNITNMAKGIATIHCQNYLSDRDVFDACRLAWDSIPIDRADVIRAFAQGMALCAMPLQDALKSRAFGELMELGIVNNNDTFTPRFRDLVELVGKETLIRIGKDTA